jgi:hypothetical protein
MKDFVDELGGRPVGGVLRCGLALHQASFPLALEGCSPAIKTSPANPKIPTGLGNVAYLLGVPESP